MLPQHGNPQALAQAQAQAQTRAQVEADLAEALLAEDRRRTGRADAVSPQLVPLLRGQIDPDAPADPKLPKPGARTPDRELVSGAAITMALLLVGVMLRFAV